MRRLLYLMSLSIGLFAAQTTLGQITGSAHDFSASTWNSTDEICIVCHTPHNADVTVANAPLWNHQLSTVSPYTVYTSLTLDATVGQPSASSKLCLSCHDGSVALENFGGVTTGINFISGGANIGGTSHGDLSNDHPISFTYNTALATADGGLHDPATQSSGLGSTIDDDLLFGGKMECASCHDVHNAYNNLGLLVKPNTASALCLTCHDK